MTLSTEQTAYLSTAGLIFATLIDAPDATEVTRADAFVQIGAIISQAKVAGFDDATIAQAMRLPIFLVAGVA